MFLQINIVSGNQNGQDARLLTDRHPCRTFAMVKPWVATVDSFFSNGLPSSYHEVEWLGENDYPEEVHEVHRAIKQLAEEIESSSISNKDELKNWAASVREVAVSLLQITSRCRAMGDPELRLNTTAWSKRTASSLVGGSNC